MTLPKLRLEEVTANTPGVTPVPDSDTASVAFEALLRMETFPLTAPPACGEKVTGKLALCPAASVKGKLNPLTEKPVPETFTWLMVTLDPPELVNVSCRL